MLYELFKNVSKTTQKNVIAILKASQLEKNCENCLSYKKCLNKGSLCHDYQRAYVPESDPHDYLFNEGKVCR